MARKTSSIKRKRRELRQEHDARMKEALAEYRKFESLPLILESKPSIRSVAIKHKVSPATLGRLLKGGISIAEFNARKRHLTSAEERVLLNFTQDQAKRGFPLTHRLIEERANAILQVRKGSAFTVGGMWVSRFLSTHAEELGVYWSRPLDRSRASGLNPIAVGWYFDTLEELDRKYMIPTENWYAGDESGIALGLAGRMLVIGPAGERVQHKQQDGEREIVTVMETICADGSVLAPTVIFKGQNLLKKWGAYNPCEASIGVGPNGYMDSELALAYLEEFDKKTKGKNDSPRVLMLDGHVSHCSLAFLDRAVELGIFVVSYPPHTTHRLQGLDVVIFATLKRHWQLLRDARERATGLPVKKEDFLAVYAPARTAAFTSENIKEAFRKTGAHPIDRTVVSEDEMLPSRATTNQADFPAYLASPVKAVLAAHRIDKSPTPTPNISTATVPAESVHETEIPSSSTPTENLPNPSQYSPSKRAQVMNFLLERTSASFLVNTSAELTNHEEQRIPAAVFERPAKDVTPRWSLLQCAIPTDKAPQREIAMELMTEFGRAKAYSGAMEACLETSHAQLVLAHLEIARLQAVLKEAKDKGKGKNGRAKLMSSGAARLLTSNEFRDVVRRDEEAAAAKEVQKATAAQARALSKAKKAWRTEDIATRKVARAAQLETWERGCATAKRGKKSPPKKPKPPTRPQTPDDEFFMEQLGLGVGEDDDDDDEDDVEEE